MRYVFLLLVSFFIANCRFAIAQKAVYSNSFPACKEYYTSISIFGTALDLTKNNPVRTVLEKPYPLSQTKQSFSVSLWVKADTELEQAYTILSSYEKTKDSVNGWKIAVQPNGAWSWVMDDGKIHYDYSPTAKRQTITNGKWHQLVFTYNAAKEEAILYYDGTNVAVLYVPGLKNIATKKLLIGGDIKGDLGEWETFNGCIDEVQLSNEILSPSFILKSSQGKFPVKKNVLQQSKTLSVMNYNIWHGGRETGKEIGVSRIVDVIKNSGADIISMQETYGSGPAIADAMGYYFYLRSSNLSIMSRYPIEETVDGHHPFYNGGAFIRLQYNKRILFFVNWLNYPIDYWELLGKEETLDKDDWLNKQKENNANFLSDILQKIYTYTQMSDSVPVFFCGDFNAGSHFDWTEATKHLNKGFVMPFPNSILMEEKGFKDSYRVLHPDPLKDRGITWTPKFPTQFQDRIDYIYYKSNHVKPIKSFTINTHPVQYPSDHAAVVTIFELKN